MKLVPNAKDIAKKSHSMWANYLGVGCLLTPELIYYFLTIDTNPRLWWLAGVGLIIYGIIGRLKDQGISRSPFAAVLLALALTCAMLSAPAQAAQVSEQEFLAEATPLVARWEGKRNKAYLDRIASPPVWTICFGETRGVKAGDYKTDAECEAMLQSGLLEFRVGLHRSFTDDTRKGRLTPKRDAAYVSLVWNAGVRAISRSTAVRRLNAGNIAGGCHALTWWNKAGGRVIRGLVYRRSHEHGYCMAGL